MYIHIIRTLYILVHTVSAKKKVNEMRVPCKGTTLEVLVPLKYCLVPLKYHPGTLQVLSKYCSGTILVLSKYCCGTLQLQCGTLPVQVHAYCMLTHEGC